ncbi:MAG: glycosyltransferase [bacterium]
MATTQAFQYALITPARNEEAFIERTVKAVVSQTVLPQIWVIVNDGSSDRTAEIAGHYASQYDFIRLIHISRNGERDFGAKAFAFQYGYDYLRGTSCAFVGNLDADVEFETTYFERLLQAFDNDPRLGLAGGIIFEYDGREFIRQNTGLSSVAGAVQLFRRRCYEEIGGYVPLELGGIDTVVEVLARKHGWKVQTFPELRVMHHRRVAREERRNLAGQISPGVDALHAWLSSFVSIPPLHA